MKNLRLLIVAILLYTSLTAQVRTSILVVPDASTNFGIPQPIGAIVYDQATNTLYEITAVASGTTTLTTATKETIGGSSSVSVRDSLQAGVSDSLLIGTNSLVVKKDGSIGVNNINPRAASIFDITSTSQGFLIPRMTNAERDAISLVTQDEGLQIYSLTNSVPQFYNGTVWTTSGGTGTNTGDDKQALISFRKTAGQTVSTLSGESDNIITFPVANPAPTATAVMDFDGTVLEVKQRHPSKLSRLVVGLVLSSSHNSGVSVTVNLRVSTDGGGTYPIIANTETFGMLPKSGGTNSTLFIAIGEWVSPQPSTVPVHLKVQVFADVASVVTVEPGSTFNLNGVYK